MKRFTSSIGLLLFFIARSPAEDKNHADVIKADNPVASWSFETKPKEIDRLVSGPRPPAFPAFSPKNQAVEFSGSTQVIKTPHREELQFSQGDTITLEAWVDLASIGDNQNMYIIGKGRTLNQGFAPDNQNYALRLRGLEGEARLSFLFRSQQEENRNANWHRWNSKSGFMANTGWRHVAVSYEFGKPDSIKGYIDGKPVKGFWDMGGPTTQAPVVDQDEIWIGGSLGKSANSAFNGSLDEIAIYRKALSPERIKARFVHVPQPIEPEVAKIVPDGKVVMEICEKDCPSNKTWPRRTAAADETYDEDAFGFFRTPLKYIETGIRADRKNPFLLRASANVTLPKGQHTILIRSRNAARLKMDGKIILSLPFRGGFLDGHNTVKKDYLELAPDLHYAFPGSKEKSIEIDSTGMKHQFIYEMIVGGKRGKDYFRPELGESSVSLKLEGHDHFILLSPTRTVRYTAENWKSFIREKDPYYTQLDTDARRKAFAAYADKWSARHKKARQQIGAESMKGSGAHEIDRLINRRIVEIQKGPKLSEPERYFHRFIRPVLEEKCANCHVKKNKGDLNLASLAGALKGGESEQPAIVPGHPEKSLLYDLITRATDDDEFMPAKGEGLTPDEIGRVEKWIKDGAAWTEHAAQKEIAQAPLCDDLVFLRRLTLDTAGVIPSTDEIETYLQDPSAQRRQNAIERLFKDDRWADHWVAYWQDLLAENPNIVKPSLNNSGPFRWWIHDAFLDNKPMDLFVTELVQMKGSKYDGGPAGFELATQNDVPMAAKAGIIAGAFLGVQMKCARCHDAPFHDIKQEQLFSLAAMLAQKPIKVPASSSVPLDKLHSGGRKPLVSVTLKTGTRVPPAWPFPNTDQTEPETNSRLELARQITSPKNKRFAQVMVNRLWKRYMGIGLVEPIDDWEKAKPSHPELLEFLGREFIRGGYDLKHIARMIFNSDAYARIRSSDQEPQSYFQAANRRRMTAEQVVDSLFASVGLPMETEPITQDLDGSNRSKNFVHLGRPRRGWMFSSLSNERDRPSLSLPRAQAVVDVLTAFGWRPSRQEPLSQRMDDVNVLQPAINANGTMGGWITRLSDQHEITDLCLEADSLDTLIATVFLRMLTRHPTEEETTQYAALLQPGFADRVVRKERSKPARKPPRFVTWSNHLNPEANEIMVERQKEVREAYQSTERLAPDWRGRMEDMIWALVNSPEMITIP